MNQTKNKKILKAVWECFLLVLLALLGALIYTIFIAPNNFAPSGIIGFATMVQYVFGFEVGLLSLIVNLPILLIAFFILGRSYSLKTLLFTVVFSVALLMVDFINLEPIIYRAPDAGEAILAAIAAGLFDGAIYSYVVKLGGSTGGTDVTAAFVNHKYPEFNTVWIIFSMNVAVAVLSYFVYGMGYRPVILCAVYVFVAGKVSDAILKGARKAAKFEVVTTHPEELSQELMQKLGHGCTAIPVKGMYTGTDKFIVMCVVNPRQVADFERIIQKYDNTLAFISTVNGTFGQFMRVK